MDIPKKKMKTWYKFEVKITYLYQDFFFLEMNNIHNKQEKIVESA